MIPMNIDDIVPRFEWVLDEMRQGMGFIKASVPGVGHGELEERLPLVSKPTGREFVASMWSDACSGADRESCVSLSDHVAAFQAGHMDSLAFDYTASAARTDLGMRILFDGDLRDWPVEILCYRDAILGSSSPRDSLGEAIQEFRRVYSVLGGTALFIGPNSPQAPCCESECEDGWMRID